MGIGGHIPMPIYKHLGGGGWGEMGLGRGAGGDRKEGISMCTRIERNIPGLMCCFGVDGKL